MIKLFLTLSGRVLWAGALLLIGSLVISSPGISQSTKQSVIAQLGMALAQRSLWGRDYAALIASIPGWARIQEKTIVIAPDVLFGGTPFGSREEAETHAERLAAALTRISHLCMIGGFASGFVKFSAGARPRGVKDARGAGTLPGRIRWAWG